MGVMGVVGWCGRRKFKMEYQILVCWWLALAKLSGVFECHPVVFHAAIVF